MMMIRLDSKGVQEAIPPAQYVESLVESAVEKAPAAFLGMDVLLIGRQVRTDRGVVDLLGLDRDGNTVIIELKRYDSPREIVSQAISYRSHFRKTATSEHLNQIAEKYFGDTSPDGTLIRTKFKDRFGTFPRQLNKKQIVALVAVHFPESVLHDLEEIADHICIEFSYYRSDKGEDFFAVKRVSEPDLPPALTAEQALRDFDQFFKKVIEQVKQSLPQELTTFRNTQAHTRNAQWMRFHWKGSATHVGLWTNKGKGTAKSEICVYFYNKTRDPAIVKLLTRNADLIRKSLQIGVDDVFNPDEKTSIEKYVGEENASVAVTTFISVLKPLLGEKL